MKNMMSQVRNSNRSFRWLVLVLTVLCTVLSGCKKPEEPVDPFVVPGNTENPNWVLTVENDMTNSMTVIVKVSFTDQPGSLAAFIGNECCGIGSYNAEVGLYWLFISPAPEPGGNVQLRFYSPDLKRIFDAKETFPFRNDDTEYGSISAPFTPSWIVAE